MSDATLILGAVAKGEPQAAERLLVLVYNELRSLASRRMARERTPQTLQPTALVHGRPQVSEPVATIEFTTVEVEATVGLVIFRTAQ
jgi:hypothetical protein